MTNLFREFLLIDILELCQLVKLLNFMNDDHKTGFIIYIVLYKFGNKQKTRFFVQKEKKTIGNTGTKHSIKYRKLEMK